jgi:integrase
MGLFFAGRPIGLFLIIDGTPKFGLSENRSCRDTRGTFITNALDANETMGFVQNQVGHSSIKPIVNHYYNRIPSDEDGQKLEEALKSTRVLPDLEEE